jgi:MFS transporter, OFA family, oxalate/formate antiporter
MGSLGYDEEAHYAAQRWVTLAASAIASMCCGFFYAWSVLVKPMMETYDWSSSDVSLAFTLVVAVPGVCTLIAGKLQQYVRPPTLLLVAGAILSLGTILLSFATSLGLLYVFAFVAGVGGMTYPGATMGNLMRFFPDRRGMASGVLTAGFGLGTVIWGPAAVLLMEEVGFKWTLRILGVLFFVIVAVCSRLVTVAPAGYLPRGWTLSGPAGDAGGTATDGEGAVDRASRGAVGRNGAAVIEKDWKAMFGTATFWLLAVVFVIGLTSGLMVTAHASPIAQQVLGITAEAAGAFVSYLALGMVVGKVGWGVLSDRFGRSPVLVAMLLLAVAALTTLWQTSAYATVVLGIFVVGTCYGGFLALIGPVTLDAFGPKHFPVNFGIMFLTVGVASYVGPRLAAAVVEANDGVYNQAFLIAALLTVAGLVLAGVYVWLSRRAPAVAGRSHS